MLPLPPPTFVRVEDVTIATYVLGPPDPVGRDIVLCHGTPWSARTWAAVAGHLASSARVHLWDMPGYGASRAGPEVPLDLPTQSRRLARLTEMWDLDRPLVAAHDIGGAVALGAHLREDLELAGLALLDVVTLDPWGSPFFRLVSEHHDAFAALPAELHRALVTAYIGGAATARIAGDTIDALVAPWLGPDGQAAFYRQITQLSATHTRPLTARLDEVRCAARVAWGRDDAWVPVEQAHRLAAALPGEGDPLLIDRAGHLILVEQPVVIAEWILRVLE